MPTHVCHLASDFHAQCNCQLQINCQCTHSAKVFSIPLLLCVHRCFAAAAIYIIMSAAVPKEFRPLIVHCAVSCFEVFSLVFQSPDDCQLFCSKSALIDRDGCYCQRKFSSLHCATRTKEMWQQYITTTRHHLNNTSPQQYIHHHNNTSSQQYTITTIHHYNNTSPQQYIITTIHHHNSTSSQQYTITTIHHHNNTSPQQYITSTIHHLNNTSSQQYIITTIHHHNNKSPQQYITTTIYTPPQQ